MTKKRPVGRPKKPEKFELDLSMDVETAKDQRIIAQTKNDIYKSKIQELAYNEACKKLIDFNSVIEVTTEVFSRLKIILYAGANNLAPMVVGEEPGKVSKILYDWIDNSLVRFAAEMDKRLNTVQSIEEEQDIETDNEDESDN